MTIEVEMTYERLKALFELEKHPSLGAAGIAIVKALREGIERVDENIKANKAYKTPNMLSPYYYNHTKPIKMDVEWDNQTGMITGTTDWLTDAKLEVDKILKETDKDE